MNPARLLYRTRQFWQALGAKQSPEDLALAQRLLSPAQLALFYRMQPAEQAHSLRVARDLLAQGEKHPDLFVAALLHDVGKSRFPLSLWERVLVVLVRAICPGCLKRWGRLAEETSSSGGPRRFGWRRPFVVAETHPEWGAQLAAEAGASPLGAALIGRHQEALPGEGGALEDRLLRKLQAADDQN